MAGHNSFLQNVNIFRILWFSQHMYLLAPADTTNRYTKHVIIPGFDRNVKYRTGTISALSRGQTMMLLSNSGWIAQTQSVFFVSRTWWLFPGPRNPGCDNPGREKHSFEINR
jgi:hypothetical protein